MITCPSCGSQTSPGVTCVVCGATPADAGPRDPASADGPDVAPALDPGTAADDGGRDDDELVTTGPSPAPESAWPSAPSGAAPGGAPRPGSPPPRLATGPTPPPAVGTSPAWPATPTPPRPGAVAITEASRNWGMIAHLSALVAAGLGGLSFLGPLVIWLVRKDQDRFVAHHAVEALNFNLSVLLYAVLAGLVAITIIGIPLALLMLAVGFPLWFVTSIIGAVKAQRGEGYRYPLTIRLVKE